MKSVILAVVSIMPRSVNITLEIRSCDIKIIMALYHFNLTTINLFEIISFNSNKRLVFGTSIINVPSVIFPHFAILNFVVKYYAQLVLGCLYSGAGSVTLTVWCWIFWR